MTVVPDNVDDIVCPICLELYVDPLTLTCNHSFCRVCLLQSTRMAPDGRNCPSCRATITIQAPMTHEADATIQERVERHLNSKKASNDGETFENRVTDHARLLEELASVTARSLPIFYMRRMRDHPGAVIELHFFEPRYKILVRQAWEGSRKFICLSLGSSGGSHPREGHVGLLVHIEDARFMSDGRANIRGKGLERIPLGKCWQERGMEGLWFSNIESATITEADDRPTPAFNDRGPGTSSPSIAAHNEPRNAEAIADVRRRLRLAIADGAPAYNRGQIGYCVRRYLGEANGILESDVLRMGIETANYSLVGGLRDAVAFARRELPDGDVDAAAWKLRRAFDKILIESVGRRSERPSLTSRARSFFGSMRRSR